MKVAFAFFLLSAVPVSSLAQTTIHVPADQPTIQFGIDAAHNGDTVLVASGTYNENIDFHGKVITLTSGGTSFSDPATISTIINGPSDGPVVTFDSGETSGAILNGFTIQNGHSSVGATLPAAGVWISGASPTISNNLITNNTGNGILLTNLDNALIQSNSLIQGNDIRNTTTAPETGVPGGAGNGLAISTLGNIEVIGNTIENNTAYSPVVTGSPSSGGGVSITGFVLGHTFSLLLKNNVIRNNRAYVGSGIFQEDTFSPPNLTLVQNLIYDNIFPQPEPDGNYYGQQVYIGGSSQSPYPTLTEINNTIYGPGNAQELVFTFGSSVIENNNFFNSVSSIGAGPFPGEESGLWCADNFATASPLTIENNDIYNAGSLQNGGCNLGSNNLAVDAQFVNVTGNDFHTERTSPVVAAGNINAPMIPPADLDGKNRTVCGTIDMGVYEVHPQPPIVLTVSPNPAPGQSSVTLTATLTGNCNTPTGTVTFLDGTTVLGTANLNGSAVATFNTSFLFVGTHNLTATYPGDFNFAPSTSNTITEVITGPPTTTVLDSLNPNPAQLSQAVTMTATVSSAYTVPTGTVTFVAGGVVLATATVGTNGVATGIAASLSPGNYVVSAVYGGSTEYAASTSNSITLTVLAASTATALTAVPNPSNFGQAVTFTAAVGTAQSTATPTGTVTFRDGGATLGQSPLNAGGVATLSNATLSVGTHAIVANYSGSANDNPSTSNTVAQIVIAAPVALTLTADPNPANQGQAVSLAVTARPAISGTVTFQDTFQGQTTTLATASLTNGQAAISTSTLAIGTHSLSAVFAGSANNAPATSPSVSETIEAHDFAIALTPATLSVVSGREGHVAVQLNSLGSYSGTLNLSASQIPTHASLNFASTTATLGAGGSASVALTVNTASLPPGVGRNEVPGLRTGLPFGIAAACCVLPVLFGRRRCFASVLAALAALVLSVSLSGCSNISYPLNKVAPGTYLIPVSATDPTTQTTKTAQLTLVVTQ